MKVTADASAPNASCSRVTLAGVTAAATTWSWASPSRMNGTSVATNSSSVP
jgi:hypothetical protein